MIENGLLQELEDFHSLYNEERIKTEQYVLICFAIKNDKQKEF